MRSFNVKENHYRDPSVQTDNADPVNTSDIVCPQNFDKENKIIYPQFTIPLILDINFYLLLYYK